MTNSKNHSNSEIIIYQTEDGATKINVSMENETVWLSQAQMAELFQTTPQNITIHIKNIYSEGELASVSTCKDYLQVQNAPYLSWFFDGSNSNYIRKRGGHCVFCEKQSATLEK